jgi:signal transduction histidine kinase
VWAVHEGGLLEFDGARLVRRVRLEGSYAEDIERDSRSRLWVIVASEDSLLQIAPDGSRRRYGVAEGLPARALALEQSPAGELLVATKDPARLLLRHDPAADSFVPVVSQLPFEPGRDFNVYDMAIDASGRAWLASTAGLLELGGEEVRRVEIGPTRDSPAAHAVTVDDSGAVWFGTSLGVIRFDPASRQHDLFDEESGLPSKVLGIRDLFSAPDGGVTASTARGLARFTGELPPRRELPAPAFLDVRINDRSVDPDAGDLGVPYGGYLGVRFSSPHYGTGPIYQIRLGDRDEPWRAAESRNEALLAGLDGGTYTLQVRAALPGSDRTSPPAELSFTVLRPWYRSWWALLLATVAFGGVAWAATVVKSWGSARREQHLRALVDERTAELSEANRLLGERNAEMERFIYTVSHDLKSPLISISGFVGLLERDLERGHLEGAADSVARVKVSASRMATLLDELLEMSRVGRVRDEPERVEPGPLADEVAREMAPQLAEQGVEVSVQPHIPTVWADRSRLRQVLQNLLDNALKFRGDQPEPRIEVGGTSADGRARLFVRDNGMGIEPEHHEAAFELFRRLNAGIDGTGVGLSLVKRIVEVHGGRVWIESEGRPGLGTTVWVELPTGPVA